MDLCQWDRDVTRWLVANNPRADGQTYIVSDEQTYSTRQLYEWICETLGREPPRWVLPVWALRLAARAGDVLRRLTGRPMPFYSRAFDRLTGSACYVADKLRSELKWRSGSGLRAVLPQLVEQGRHL